MILRRLRSGVLAVVRLRPARRRTHLLDRPEYREVIRLDLERRARELQADPTRLGNEHAARSWHRRLRAEADRTTDRRQHP